MDVRPQGDLASLVERITAFWVSVARSYNASPDVRDRRWPSPVGRSLSINWHPDVVNAKTVFVDHSHLSSSRSGQNPSMMMGVATSRCYLGPTPLVSSSMLVISSQPSADTSSAQTLAGPSSQGTTARTGSRSRTPAWVEGALQPSPAPWQWDFTHN